MYFSKFSDWRYVGACTACVGIAMLCKEQGITVTGVCVVYEIFVAQRVSNISDCLSAESFSNNLLRKKANVFLILSYLMLIETLPHIPRCMSSLFSHYNIRWCITIYMECYGSFERKFNFESSCGI